MTKNNVLKVIDELNNFDKNPDRVAWLKYQWVNVLKDADCLGIFISRELKKIVDMWAADKPVDEIVNKLNQLKK